MAKFKHYSFSQYAKLMGVTRQTVYNWIKDPDRKIITVEIGDKTFIKHKEESIIKQEA